MSGCSLTEQISSPQLETSRVMDRVTHLKGELPAWATRILRNVSAGGGAASEPEVGRKAEVKGQGSQAHPQPSMPAWSAQGGPQESQLSLS